MLSGICATFFYSCEDNRGEYLDDYASMVYFRNGGEQTLTLYRVGENTVYEIPICKGGSDRKAETTVTLAVMDQAQLDIYNMANETSYTQLSDNYYSFLTEMEFSFTKNDDYKVARVEMKTDAISALQESQRDKTYVLALQVYSDRSVSPDINLLILHPDIDIPELTLATSGLESYAYTSASADETTYKNSVVLSMDNRWDFECSLEVCDQAWLNDYNAENGTSFAMLPEAAYDIPETVAFVSGSNKAEFAVTIKRSSFTLLTEYVLPVRIASCTKEQFAIAEEVYLLNARLDPDQIALTEEMLSSLYTHTSGVDGQGLPGLCDGNTDTYWQSEWGQSVNCDETYGIYIDIALAEPLSSIVLKYCTRNSTYTSNIPQGIVVGVSNDGTNYSVLGEVNSGLPTTEAIWYTLPVFASTTTFRYVRFGVARTLSNDLRGLSGYVSTNLGEIELYGANLLE